MKRKRAAKDIDMAQLLLPCYGGPYDGELRKTSRDPIGYKQFDVRGHKIFLWKSIKVEYLDFETLEKAATIQPEEEPETPFGDGL